jgi:osmoprotectant transport system permease protein
MRVLVLLVVLVGVGVALAVLGPQMGQGGGAAQDPQDKTPLLQPAFEAEFLERPDGLRGLKETYNFEFNLEPKQMRSGLMYKACADGTVDVIDAFATDGRIAAYELKPLADDKSFFPPYEAAPLVRQAALEAHPELRDVLNQLAGRLSSETMRQLNYQVDEEHRDARKVAREWLAKNGLLAADAEPGSGEAGTVTIGGKDFTEQEILGEMMAQLVEHKTDLAVERRLRLGGTMICFQALNAGDLDLYADYTGTGLVQILKRDAVSDPQEAYDIVQKEFQEQFDLTWLKPFGFDNTYAVTMRREQADRLGLDTISDMAEYVRANAAETEAGE